MAPLFGRRSGDREIVLAFVLRDVGIDDAADIATFIFLFFQKTGVFRVLIVHVFAFDVGDIFGFGVDHRHAGVFRLWLHRVFFFVFVVGHHYGGFTFDGIDHTRGFGLLGVFRLFFIVIFAIGDGFGLNRLGLTRAALLVERLRLERKRAFRAFDRALLQIVESCAARRADALYAEISLDQCNTSRVSMGFPEVGSFATLFRPCQSGKRGSMTLPEASHPMVARRSGPLTGTAVIPGDKSISHRALILGALAVGETKISGLLEAEDVLNTVKVMRQFGADVVRDGAGEWRMWGTGVGGWNRPDAELDFGNSGTGSRLVMGAMATTPISAVFNGDVSLRKRPMRRVLEPLAKFGATYDGDLMPLTLHGADRPICIDYDVTVASAQVKSALLLAALNAPGRTRVVQKELTRDHTEKMLRAFGADISVEPLAQGEAIHLMGEAELKPCAVDVPRDPSSAAFPLVAALIVPGSEVSIPGVLLNPRRIGLIETLLEMGAQIAITNRRESGGEEIGDLVVKHSALRAVEVPPDRAPSMIDEYPILAVAAAFAGGRTIMRGLGELRVKESDRLAAIVAGLRANRVKVDETEDSMTVHGGVVEGGGRVATHIDHRIAMSFLVMGLASRETVTVDDVSMIATSFPEFQSLMQNLGAEFVHV